MKFMTVALVAAMAVVCARAEAAVYTFTPTIASGASPYYDQANLSFSIGIDDAAVRSGSFSYDVRYRYNLSSNSFISSATGNVQALQFFQTQHGVSVTAGSTIDGFYEDYFDVNLTFNTLGQVTSGNLDFSTDTYYTFINGMNQVFAGTSGFGSPPPANVFGSLAGGLPLSVPEPTAVGLMLFALGGCAAMRRDKS